MERLGLLALAIVPGLLWLAWVAWKDRDAPEPHLLLALAFALGAASTLAVLGVRPLVEDLLPASDGPDRWLADAFLVTAPLEEAVKILAFVIGLAWLRHVDEPMDGLVYGAAIGLGFASIENAMYAHGHGTDALVVVGSRTFTAMLLHATATALFAFGLTVLRLHRTGHAVVLAAALGIAVTLLHGLYDLCLMLPGPSAWLGPLAALPILLIGFGAATRWSYRARGRNRVIATAGGS